MSNELGEKVTLLIISLFSCISRFKRKKLGGFYSSIISATCLSFSLPDSQPQSQCDGTKYGDTRKGRSFMNMNRTSARNSKDDLQLVSDKMFGCLELKFTFSVIR